MRFKTMAIMACGMGIQAEIVAWLWYKKQIIPSPAQQLKAGVLFFIFAAVLAVFAAVASRLSSRRRR